MKQYTPSSHWYILQFLPVLPLALIALGLSGYQDTLLIVAASLIISVGYILVTSYRVYQQVRHPMIATDEQGILLHFQGNGVKHIDWKTIKGVSATSFCIKLDTNNAQEAIPTNALGDSKKDMLLDEIVSRTKALKKLAA